MTVSDIFILQVSKCDHFTRLGAVMLVKLVHLALVGRLDWADIKRILDIALVVASVPMNSSSVKLTI